MITFTKMHGLGNDYVYLDCTKKKQPDNIEDLAIFMSNRHFGVGSDGLILIDNSNTCDFKMRMFNSDGSEAQMCGNGIRCVGKFVYDKKMTKKKKVTIETLAGVKTLFLQVEKEKVKAVTVDMGEPILEASKIPVVFSRSPVTNFKLKALDREFSLTCVSMGNPHAIIEVENLEKFPVKKYGEIIEKDSHFPERVNVEFITIKDKTHIEMRVWERGAGETFACGTGACAAICSCILNGKIERRVEVSLLGGTLEIFWDPKDNHTYMTGPATTVFEGEMEEENDNN